MNIAPVKPTEGKGLKKNQMALLLDKLGERLAAERQGVRLYDALINKVWTLKDKTAPDIKELSGIRDQELEHFALLGAWIRRLGGDPKDETVSAEMGSVASRGIIQVVADPRTTVSQSLSAILAAELADNAGWELLIDLAALLNLHTMIAEFHSALQDEREHLEKVKGWIAEDLARRVN